MSNLISCPTCNKPVAASASQCPHCGEENVGEPLDDWIEEPIHDWIDVGLALFFLLVGIFIILNLKNVF
jgi:predicted amidophosphoribosyltransferase